MRHKMKKWRNEEMKLPDNDDCKIEQVPRIAQVGATVSDESVCNYLHDAFDGENDQEDVLHFFLINHHHQSMKKKKKNLIFYHHFSWVLQLQLIIQQSSTTAYANSKHWINE